MSTKHLIEACRRCCDPEFYVTESELKDAEGWIECDKCATPRYEKLDPNELYERLVKYDLHKLVSSLKSAQDYANKVYYLLANTERDENLIAIRKLVKFYRDACDHFADTIERLIEHETEDL